MILICLKLAEVLLYDFFYIKTDQRFMIPTFLQLNFSAVCGPQPTTHKSSFNRESILKNTQYSRNALINTPVFSLLLPRRRIFIFCRSSCNNAGLLYPEFIDLENKTHISLSESFPAQRDPLFLFSKCPLFKINIIKIYMHNLQKCLGKVKIDKVKKCYCEQIPN